MSSRLPRGASHNLKLLLNTILADSPQCREFFFTRPPPVENLPSPGHPADPPTHRDLPYHFQIYPDQLPPDIAYHFQIHPDQLPPDIVIPKSKAFYDIVMPKCKAFYEGIAFPTLRFPARLAAYKFHDAKIQSRAFTCRGSEDRNPEGSGHNERLEWLGDGLLKGRHTVLLFDYCEDMDESALTLLRSALENNMFYAHLSKLLGLDKEMIGSQEQQRSNSKLGDLFEAYVGGMFLDMRAVIGSEVAMERLNAWIDELMMPFLIFYKELFFDEIGYLPTSATTGEDLISRATALASKAIAIKENEALITALSTLSLSPSSSPSSGTAPKDLDLPRYTSMLVHRIQCLTGRVVTSELYSESQLNNGMFVCTVLIPDVCARLWELESEERRCEGLPGRSKKLAQHLASWCFFERVGRRLGWT